MGVKELHTTLQDTHNVQIAYLTLWRGRDKALYELFGIWEESSNSCSLGRKLCCRKYQKVLWKLMPVQKMVRYNSISSFCAFGPCIRGFSMGADHILAQTLQHLMVDGMDTFFQLQVSMDITGCLQWILGFLSKFFWRTGHGL